MNFINIILGIDLNENKYASLGKIYTNGADSKEKMKND